MTHLYCNANHLHLYLSLSIDRLSRSFLNRMHSYDIVYILTYFVNDDIRFIWFGFIFDSECVLSYSIRIHNSCNNKRQRYKCTVSFLLSPPPPLPSLCDYAMQRTTWGCETSLSLTCCCYYYCYFFLSVVASSHCARLLLLSLIRCAATFQTIYYQVAFSHSKIFVNNIISHSILHFCCVMMILKTLCLKDVAWIVFGWIFRCNIH